MKSHADTSFWACYHRLSSAAQRKADETYLVFRDNPDHPSLRFKPLRGPGRYWSVRVSEQYRAVGVREGDTIIWFWIGTHNEFDKLF